MRTGQPGQGVNVGGSSNERGDALRGHRRQPCAARRTCASSAGRGQYTDDINRPGQTYAFILRSPHAHAKISGIDTAGGEGDAGRGGDVHRRGHGGRHIGGIPCGWQIHNKDGSPMAEPPHPVLAVGKVRHVGDPVAVVIAETQARRKDAGGGDRRRLRRAAGGRRRWSRARPRRAARA